MRPTEEGCGGGRTEKEKEEVLLELVGCEENEGCKERAFGCIGVRGVGNRSRGGLPSACPQSGTRGKMNPCPGQRKKERIGDTLSEDSIRKAVPD